ncbi:HlyD family secretion protein [Desulfovibrio gilichinskyi]|uniref:HlyD family secretion protein n=1 Tax=Desulfovibrio gilichinskyi TaxID=1519643 RepID=A0A1X7CWI1_9BACT|nr:HlyD family efflux transporter periplasmic adaptor subunit [Desulfovibrio gilichinskyi]SMF04419.1 HlyD family secretion protein [Desulfovibrio gilichinskyi]
MKINLLSKKVTWMVVIVIALLPLPSIANYMQRFVVRNGIVTAFRYEVHAPIDGVVENLSVRPGSVPGVKPVLLLGNRRMTGQHEALEQELTSLEQSLKQSIEIRVEYLDRISRDLDQSLGILRARLIGEKAAQEESEHRRDRTLKLVKSSVATKEDADRVESEYRKDEAKVKTTQLEIIQLKERRQMLDKGMIPQDLSDGVLQVQSRINILQQSILACKRRMSETETGIIDNSVPSKDSKQNINNRSARASVMIPDTSVIWEVDVQNGMEVSKGDRILSYIDRSRLMVEVSVDDAVLELLKPGHPVKIRLFGKTNFIEGKVSRIMGSAGIWHSSLLAASIKQRAVRDGRVLVQIEDKELYNDVEKFCGVGRTAYAEFEGIGLLEQYFGVFLR